MQQFYYMDLNPDSKLNFWKKIKHIHMGFLDSNMVIVGEMTLAHSQTQTIADWFPLNFKFHSYMDVNISEFFSTVARPG